MVCLVTVVGIIGRTAPHVQKEEAINSDVDVEAIKEEVKSQVLEEITKKVTNDIMAMLCDQECI